MNIAKFSFLLFSLSTFKELNKKYLKNLGKETKKKYFKISSTMRIVSQKKYNNSLLIERLAIISRFCRKKKYV